MFEYLFLDKWDGELLAFREIFASLLILTGI